MEWISAKDRLPEKGIIVAIMVSRQQQSGDPIEDANIVILRSQCDGDEWRSMDCTQVYYLPFHNDEYYIPCWSETIEYWMPWIEFKFPESMIVKEERFI